MPEQGMRSEDLCGKCASRSRSEGARNHAPGDAYVSERVALLKQSLDEVDGLAARGELPDAAVSESGLKITPLTNTVPEEASVLMRRAYALLPPTCSWRLIAGQGSASISVI